MIHGREKPGLLDILLDHYIVFCVFFALLMMTLTGVGDVRTVSMAGLLLCAAGLAQPSAAVDLWVFIPLVLYNGINMASSYAAHGNVTEGYGGIQMILPTIYLLTACMDDSGLLLLKRMCVVWAGILAAAGLVGYVAGALLGEGAGRMGGPLGNPNASGIFLVMGWFAVQKKETERSRADRGTDRWERIFAGLEPVLLAALALTLSMGSFVAMAAGILVLFFSERKRGRKEWFRYVCRTLAKASFGIGTGLLLYLGAARSGAGWVCVPLLLYVLAQAFYWKDLECFLQIHTRMAAGLAAGGILVAGLAVWMRPAAYATFAERLEMMRSGFSYLTAAPVFGVGPFRWRLLDMQDGGTYFATWHIHNVLLHAAVEFGLAAAAVLIWLAVRFYRKRADACTKAGFTAYCVHNLMDTSFFYIGITSFALILAGNPGEGGRRVGGIWLKALFLLLAGLHAVHFYNISALQAGVLP